MMQTQLLYIHVLPVDSQAANAVQVLSMCQAFSKLGIDVTLAVPAGSAYRGEREYKEAIKKKMGVYPEFSIITFRQYTIFGRLKLLGGYFPVRKLLGQVKPDLVFLRNIVFVGAAIKNNIPFIYESHNSLMHEKSGLLNRIWTNYIIRASGSHLMKKFVAISGALGDYWIGQGMPKEKVLSVHDGFDAENFRVSIRKDQARKMLGLTGDKKIVLYMGSLYRDRGIENIIDMAEKLPDACFLIVGGPENEKERYQSIAMRRGLGNIRFWGNVNHKEVPKYLFAADILLMTWSRKVKTIEYCSPLKLFEYMASGRVIVGHGFTTIKEVLVDGEDAYLVDPDSVDDLFEKLKLALGEDRQVFGERVRKKAFDEYTWEKRARLILDSIESSESTR